MSTKEFGCFYCPGKSSDYSGKCDICDRHIDIADELISKTIDTLLVKSIIGRGFYGWTLLVTDNYQSYALKLIPKHRLNKRMTPESEAHSLAACSPHRNIARLYAANDATINIFGELVDVLCLRFEYFPNAVPLRVLIENDSIELTRHDVIGILSGVASGLQRMHANNLWHHDLHDDNILIRTVEKDENIDDHYEAKLIDFGSTEPLALDNPEKEERSDYTYLSKHIYNLIARFEKNNQAAITPVDRLFSEKMRRLAHRIADTNVSRRNLTPEIIYNEIRGFLAESATGFEFPTFEEMEEQSNISFKEPLENTNALTLAPQDIALLFRDSLGWQTRIESSEPVIVVGPRGCGKTMLLRYLSMASQARPRRGEATREMVYERLCKTTNIGFLVSGGQLRTPFIRSSYKKLEINDANLAEDFCREYINAHFALSILRTIIWFYNELLSESNIEELNPLIYTVNNLLPDELLPNQTNMDIIAASERIERRIVNLSNLISPEDYKPSNLCRDDILSSLAAMIKKIPWFSQKNNIFLFDDYSVTVLPDFVQRAYNPVLFHLSSNVRITISSEGDGPVLDDNLNRKYKEGRELSFVNLGEIYFHAQEDKCREFLESILEARFNEIGKGSMKQLKSMLGEHDYEKSFGKYICTMSRAGDSRFYGFGLLCRLCSGDVSFIIELLHSLAKGRWGNEIKQLSAKAQDEIIKRFAQRQLADLKRIATHGPTLYLFAEQMGLRLRQYLLDSCEKKNIDERLRIEIEGAGELSHNAQIVHDSLLRHSVLITGGSGKSKKGLPTRKLFFRRLFSPCFPFSPNRGGCIALTIAEYEQWLLDPKLISRPPANTDQLILGE